jgi:hypothetical protein
MVVAARRRRGGLRSDFRPPRRRAPPPPGPDPRGLDRRGLATAVAGEAAPARCAAASRRWWSRGVAAVRPNPSAEAGSVTLELPELVRSGEHASDYWRMRSRPALRPSAPAAGGLPAPFGNVPEAAARRRSRPGWGSSRQRRSPPRRLGRRRHRRAGDRPVIRPRLLGPTGLLAVWLAMAGGPARDGERLHLVAHLQGPGDARVVVTIRPMPPQTSPAPSLFATTAPPAVASARPNICATNGARLPVGRPAATALD